MTIQVKIRRNNITNILPIHRIALRQIPLNVLEEAFKQLNRGYSSQFVCATLGVSEEIMEGVLMKALEEVLWERGHLAVGSS